MTQKVIRLTSGTSWPVPPDWNNADNKIQCYGGGSGGASHNDTTKNGAGAGGAYADWTNLTLTAGTNISYGIGAGGTGETGSAAPKAGGDTFFNGTSISNATIVAKGAAIPGTTNTAGTGGQASACVGQTKHSGGNGGAGAGAAASGPGGGGAATPTADGTAGSVGVTGTKAGGNGGASGVAGGTGGTTAGTNGTAGGDSDNGGSGGGGGGNSGTVSGNGGNGGFPGGGGGAGASDTGNALGGSGGAGEIIITYTPVSTTKPRRIGITIG